MKLNNIFVFVAHPDDEVLGAGGTIAKFVNEDKNVRVLFCTNGVGARSSSDKGAIEERKQSAFNALDCLGVSKNSVSFLDFPDNQMDTIPLLAIIQKAQAAIADFEPDLVITHFHNDLNVDHRIVNDVAYTLFRPQPGCSVKALWEMSVNSATNWRSGQAFTGNIFVDISSTHLLKENALQAYECEMKPFPHARSIDAISAKDKAIGAEVGVRVAEQFVSYRSIF